MGDLGSIPGLGKSSGGGHGNPLQYTCLENPDGQRSLVDDCPWGHRVRHDRVTKHSTHYQEMPMHRYQSDGSFKLLQIQELYLQLAFTWFSEVSCTQLVLQTFLINFLINTTYYRLKTSGHIRYQLPLFYNIILFLNHFFLN